MSFMQRVEAAVYGQRYQPSDATLTGALTKPDAEVRSHLLSNYTYVPELMALAQAWRPDSPRPPREGLSLIGQALVECWAKRHPHVD